MSNFCLFPSYNVVRRLKTARFQVTGAVVASLALFSVAAQQVFAQVSVTTQHYDNLRTGANLNETILTPANVSGMQQLFTISLDSNVNGQVLYVPNLTINGAKHNAIFVHTSNDRNGASSSVYAFDADTAGPALWRCQLPVSAKWTTASPVIDPTTNTIYAITKETGVHIQKGVDQGDGGPAKLYAIDLLTGAEKPGSPVVVAASVYGRGGGNVNHIITFDSAQANERPGLLLLNGNVYCAFAHMSDSFPYQGWILGYHYDGSKFTQTSVFCTAKNGNDAGIWMGGMGLTADDDGNIYATVGNGTCTAFAGGSSYAMCIIKLQTPQLLVTDWFSPFDELTNSNHDLDISSVGVIGIPGTDRLFSGATKSGSGYLLDSNDLGGFTTNGPDNIVQRFDNMCSTVNIGQNPVCWDAGAVKYVYLWPKSQEIGQFLFDPSTDNFRLNSNNPVGYNTTTSGFTRGGSMTVSANGNSNGILWAVGNEDFVHAFDATDLSKPPIWSHVTPTLGHFQFPTVVNGKLYVPTGVASIVVFGLPAQGPRMHRVSTQ